jgi:hypothetical protein
MPEAGTVWINAQVVWDRLAAERTLNRECILCPRPPYANLWLEAVIADGSGRRMIGAQVARTGMSGPPLSTFDLVLTGWYGRGLDPSLPAAILSKPVATMVDVWYWEKTCEKRAFWAGKFLYWLAPGRHVSDVGAGRAGRPGIAGRHLQDPAARAVGAPCLGAHERSSRMTQGAAMLAQELANMSERWKRHIEPKFYCSRSKLGKDRVFYVVWRYEECFAEDGKPLAFGYSATVEEAEARMAEITGPCPEIEIIRNAKTALYYHRKLAEENRRCRPPSRKQSSAVVEFVYQDYESGEDCQCHAIPHRIIRRTPRRVFVNTNPYHDGKDIWDGRTYALDRAELEQTGSAFARRRWFLCFWASMEAFHRDHRSPYSEPPSCLAFFGLKLPANVDSLKAVYRERAKKAHPDRGGSAEDFRQVEAQYQAALRFLAETQ